MTKRRERRSDTSVRDDLSIATRNIGGSVERPTKDWVVRPLGAPSSSRTVTTATPVGNDPAS